MMFQDKEKQVELLAQETTSLHYLECTICDKRIEYSESPFVKDAARYFYAMDWRHAPRTRRIYCPHHAKMYMKVVI
jgi:hypothetical protein